jgi:hypothetical protein
MNNKTSLFLIIFLITTNPTTSKNSQDNIISTLKKNISEPKSCRPEILRFYLNQNGKSESSYKTNKTSEICPSITQTCCDFEEMVKLHNIGKESYDKMILQIELLKRVTNKVADMPDNLRDFVIQLIEDQEDNLEEGALDRFIYAINHIQQNRDQINHSFEIGLEFYARKNLGFSCALCDQKSHSAIQKNEKGSFIKIDRNECRSFLGADEIYDFTYSIINLKQIFIFYGELFKARNRYDHAVDIESIGNPEELEKFLKKYQNCAQKLEFEQDIDCLADCENYEIFNTNYFSMFTLDLFAYDITGEELMKNLDFDVEGNSKKNSEYYEKYYFVYFIEPTFVKNKEQALEEYNFVYEFGEGWNNLKYQFNPIAFKTEIKDIKDNQKKELIRNSMRVFSNLVLILSFFWIV